MVCEGMASPLRDDAYWVARDYAAGVEKVTARVQLIGGWQDIFLPWMLEDFGALQTAGRDAQLIIGPWTHTTPGLTATVLREGLGWLRAGLLADNRLAPRNRPLVCDRRADRRRLAPPAELAATTTGERRIWLGERGQLQAHEPARASTPDRYRYDPASPTPSLGGPVLLAREPIVDNRPLEARADVLTYTMAPLESTLEAIGPVRVELWACASSPYFDLFARVCDVDSTGASWNVCDALVRIAPGRYEAAADGALAVTFELWPIGHRFAAGHRIRLQVSSGAYPRYLRNPGTGEDPAAAARTKPVDIEILHDTAHPSVLVLPAADESH